MEKNPSVFSARFEKIYNWMAQEGISLLMLEDTESRRDQNIRWLTGHPADALLFLSADKKAILTAWDINLAKLYAAQSPVTIAGYNDFDRKPVKAISLIAKKFGVPAGAKIERLKNAENMIVDLIITIKKEKDFDVESTVNFRWGVSIHVAEKDFDLIKAIDKMIDKLETKITKEKEKMKEKR